MQTNKLENSELLAKLRASVSRTLLPNEVWEQQVSWLMSLGNESQEMTRSDAARQVEAVLGPRPKKEVA